MNEKVLTIVVCLTWINKDKMNLNLGIFEIEKSAFGFRI